MSELKLNELFEKHTVLYNDNEGCINSKESGGAHKSNKHYKIRLNRVRKAVRDGLCELRFRRTEEMIADGLTKRLPFTTMTRVWSSPGLEIVKD